jgi:hypothetical protein
MTVKNEHSSEKKKNSNLDLVHQNAIFLLLLYGALDF